MILGIGTDLANIERIQRVLDRFGDRFRNRVFTETEQRRAERMTDPAAVYAKRWAAKEACSKALGTGFRKGVFWRDMELAPLASGKPTLRLTGGALARMRALTPDGMEARVEVSLSDESGLANAVVIIFAVAAVPLDRGEHGRS